MMGERRSKRLAQKSTLKNKGTNNEFGELNFSKQLQMTGFKLRDIPGDGNCLFRALADQLEGNSFNHERFRKETVEFMKKNRSDFEPFVEDNISFDKHVNNLRELGTYAGNDAIVAFARNNEVDVVIHQLNTPMWTIKGSENGSPKQLHISYHNGDHYSSLRRINDNSNGPANIRLVNKKHNEDLVNKSDDVPRNMLDYVRSLCDESGCDDEKLVYLSLKQVDYDHDKAMEILSMDDVRNISDDLQPRRTTGNNTPSLWDSAGTGTRIFGNINNKSTKQTTNLSNKNRRDQNRRERKKRSAEKKRQTSTQQQSSDSEEITTNFSMLQI